MSYPFSLPQVHVFKNRHESPKAALDYWLSLGLVGTVSLCNGRKIQFDGYHKKTRHNVSVQFLKNCIIVQIPRGKI